MNISSQVEPLRPIEAELRLLRNVRDWRRALLLRGWNAIKWIKERVRVQQARKNLRVCENISLGDKRFVAVVQVDGERFLIGGSSNSVSLLTRLQQDKAFATELEREAGRVS